MNDDRDSYRKIEREMAAFGEPGPGPQVMTKGTIAQWAARLRALSEREQKRWDVVTEVKELLRDSTLNGESCDDVADRLREAIEDKL